MKNKISKSSTYKKEKREHRVLQLGPTSTEPHNVYSSGQRSCEGLKNEQDRGSSGNSKIIPWACKQSDIMNK